MTKRLVSLLAVALGSTIVFWVFFALGGSQLVGQKNGSLLTLAGNYDGPNYLAITKCWYKSDCLKSTFSLPLPVEYYPAHWPGYPLLVWMVSSVISGPLALLGTTLLGTLVLCYFSFKLFTELMDENKAFWLAVVMLFLPGRLFVLRMIGAPETWFLASIVGAIYYFRKEQYWVCALAVALAQSLKSPGLLVWIALLVGLSAKYNWHKLKHMLFTAKNGLWLLLVSSPCVVLTVFSMYWVQTGDFFAYFHSGDNFHLYFLPFTAFLAQHSWIGDLWLEDIVWLYLVGATGLLYLYKRYKNDVLVIFPVLYFGVTLFVGHRDIARYSTPLIPFVLLGYAKIVSQKKWRWVFLFMLPAVFLYAVNFVSRNVAPVADWTPYL